MVSEPCDGVTIFERASLSGFDRYAFPAVVKPLPLCVVVTKPSLLRYSMSSTKSALLLMRSPRDKRLTSSSGHVDEGSRASAGPKVSEAIDIYTLSFIVV